MPRGSTLVPLITYNNQRTDPTSSPSSSGGSSRSFAPSVLPELPEVVIRPPPSANPLPSLGTRIVTGIITTGARIGSRLLPLLIPMASGPDGTGDLYPPGWVPPAPAPTTTPQPEPEPDPEPELLPEVVIRPPPRPPAPVGNDPIMPPNWDDLADPGDKIFESPPGRRPVSDPTRLPFPDTGDRPSPQPLIDPGDLPNPDGPLVFPDLLPKPGNAPRTTALPYAPTIFPDPFGQPFALPIGSPGTGPRAVPRPGTSPRPGGRPPTPDPVDIPGFVGLPFGDVPRPNPRPPTGPGGGTSLPEFFTDPSPSITDDPFTDPLLNPDQPTSDDQCQCEQKPKKKKKPKRERTICRQGTYTQTKKGIIYTPRKVVPCAPAADKKSKPNGGRSSAANNVTFF